MPIGPKTLALRCSNCGWRGTVRFSGDLIGVSELPDGCRRCGSTALEAQRGPRARHGNALTQAIEVFRRCLGR